MIFTENRPSVTNWQDLRSSNPFKALATPGIFYSHWQLDILKAVMQQKSKTIALVAGCLQHLQNVAKRSTR